MCTVEFDGNAKIVRVNGMSMSPTMCNDDYAILVKVNDPKNLNIGEIVEVVTENGEEFSHRIVDVCEGGFITKGDLSITTIDGCIPYENIKYVVVGVIRK